MNKPVTLIFFLVSGFFVSKANGQIINSLSPNKTGMYYYAVDTLINIYKREYNISSVALISKRHRIKEFPESIQNVRIHLYFEGEGKSKKSYWGKKYVIKMGEISIIKDEISLPLFVISKDKQNYPWASYIIYFKYIPENKSYILRKIKRNVY